MLLDVSIQILHCSYLATVRPLGQPVSNVMIAARAEVGAANQHSQCTQLHDRHRNAKCLREIYLRTVVVVVTHSLSGVLSLTVSAASDTITF